MARHCVLAGMCITLRAECCIEKFRKITATSFNIFVGKIVRFSDCPICDRYNSAKQHVCDFVISKQATYGRFHFT